MKPAKIKVDDYFLVTVETKGGHVSSNPCMGVKLRSWINFYESLSYTKKVTYAESTKEVYDAYYYSGLDEEKVENKPKKSVQKKKTKV